LLSVDNRKPAGILFRLKFTMEFYELIFPTCIYPLLVVALFSSKPFPLSHPLFLLYLKWAYQGLPLLLALPAGSAVLASGLSSHHFFIHLSLPILSPFP